MLIFPSSWASLTDVQGVILILNYVPSVIGATVRYSTLTTSDETCFLRRKKQAACSQERFIQRDYRGTMETRKPNQHSDRQIYMNFRLNLQVSEGQTDLQKD